MRPFLCVCVGIDVFGLCLAIGFIHKDKGNKGRRMKENSPPKKPGSRAPDGGYGWLVVVAAFLINVVMVFPFIAFGILYITLFEEFQESKSTIGWVGSVFSFMAMITGLFIAGGTGRYGCRPYALFGGLLLAVGCILSVFAFNVYYLYISFGLIAGIGFGCINFCAVVIVQTYFDKRRAVAGGVALAGQPLGAFIGAICTRVWIQQYGWRGAFLLMGGVCLHCLPLAALFRPLPRPPNQAPPPSVTWRKYFRGIFDFSLMKNMEYVLFCTCAVSAMFGFGMYYQNLPSRAVSLKLTFEEASWLPPFISLSSCVSRMLLSLVANLKCANRLVMFTLLPLAAGVLATTSSLSRSFAYLAANAALFGCMVGSMLSIMPAVEVDMFGRENLARVHALAGLWFGFSGLISTPLAGFIYDVTQSYDIPFYIAGAFQFLGCLAMIAVFLWRRFKTQPQSLNSDPVASNGDVHAETSKRNRDFERVCALSAGSEMGSVASIHKACEQWEEKA